MLRPNCIIPLSLRLLEDRLPFVLPDNVMLLGGGHYDYDTRSLMLYVRVDYWGTLVDGNSYPKIFPTIEDRRFLTQELFNIVANSNIEDSKKQTELLQWLGRIRNLLEYEITFPSLVPEDTNIDEEGKTLPELA